MRKSILSILALAAILTACNKEQASTLTPQQLEVSRNAVTIEGVIVDTKTAYAGDKNFSWCAGDKISVMVNYLEELSFPVFTASRSGKTTRFYGNTGINSTRAFLAKWAVYPSYLSPSASFIDVSESDETRLFVTLPDSYALDVEAEDVPCLTSDNPLACLPLVGQRQPLQGKNYYVFATATGALKISFTKVPDQTRYFVLSSQESICGRFLTDSNGVIRIGNQISATGGKSITFAVQSREDKSLDVYVPVPVGVLSTGLSVQLLDGERNILFSRAAVKDIEVARNRVTELISINAE